MHVFEAHPAIHGWTIGLVGIKYWQGIFFDESKIVTMSCYNQSGLFVDCSRSRCILFPVCSVVLYDAQSIDPNVFEP